MGTEKSIFSVSRFPKSRFFGFVCLYLVAATALFLLCGFAAQPGADQTAGVWQYVASEHSAGIGGGKDEQWRDLHPGDRPQIDSSNQYVLLRRNFGGSDSGLLYIKTANSFVRVTVSGEIAYDSLSDRQNEAFASSSIVSVPLEKTQESKPVTVLVYCPTAFSFTAVLSSEASPLSVFSGYFTLLLLFGCCFLLLGLLAAVAELVSRREKKDAPTYLFLPAISFLLLAVSLFIQCYCSLHSSEAPDGMFALTSALHALALFLLPVFAATGLCGWNVKLEIVSSLNIIYAVAILFWPYEVFFTTLIKSGVIFHLAVFLALAMLVKEKERVQAPLQAAVSLAFFIPLLFYWLDTNFRFFSDGSLLLYIATLLTGGVLILSKLPARMRVHRSKVSKPAAPAPEAPRIAPDPVIDDSHLLNKLDDRLRELVQKKCSSPDDHMLHVAAYTRILALGMGLLPGKADQIAEAALLHDIGKLAVPYAILHKTGNLTEAEFEEIRRHHLYGERILSGTGSEFFDLAAVIAREHHEHVDGSGYLGLHDDQIFAPAKIVAVADVLDALTSSRDYKKMWSFEDAYQYICERAGTYYDKATVTSMRREKKKLYDQYIQYHPADKI